MTFSLWLTPSENHAFTKEVQELISQTIPSNFSQSLKEKHHFIPHVTLTSGIDLNTISGDSGVSAQEWLDAMQWPTFKKEFDEVIIELDHVDAGDAFFRKLVIEVNPNDNLTKLAAQCRKETVSKSDTNESHADADENEKAAQDWAKTKYTPHLSLLYADLPTSQIKAKLPLIEMQVGYGLGSLFACCGGTFLVGGSMVLVDTSKPVNEWQPIARRDTPWVNWRMSNNLA